MPWPQIIVQRQWIQQDYEDLPWRMAESDVALIPFALNEATKSISPTKTLEYLASRLPVVSTRVPDVVADFPGCRTTPTASPPPARR